MKLEFEVPIKAIATQNSRRHWAATAKLRRKERDAIALGFPKAAPLPVLILVTLTRFGPNELDKDNLQASLKGVRDEVARHLGLDDKTRLAAWLYAQLPGEYSVRVSVAIAEGPAEWLDHAQKSEWGTLRARASQPRQFAGRLSPASYPAGRKA